MAKILLATVNAKYIHAAFGLRYLRANLGPWREQSQICEFTPSSRPVDIVEQLLAHEPRIIGLSVYIWNVETSAQICALIKTIAPHTKIILGGPEVSYELDEQTWTQHADYIVQGEGEIAMQELVTGIMTGKPSLTRVHKRPVQTLDTLELPYQEYSDLDVAQRVIYVEASRGCPFRCAFCLSALDKTVRPFAPDEFLAQLHRLLKRGVRRFKFVDRTFNLSVDKSGAILDFFWEHWVEGLFLHFEMIPDRLPLALRAKLARFPPGSVQLEVGIQSLNPSTNQHISRRQKASACQDNFRFLREQTGVHIHADLIVGLPGEDWSSFLDGLDELLAWGPQEIQIGVLKRLRGAPLTLQAQRFELRFDPSPPYEVLSTQDLTFTQIQHAKRMAHLWDRIVNQGRFPTTLREGLWAKAQGSKSRTFDAFTHWMHSTHERVHGWSAENLARFLGQYLHTQLQCPRQQVAAWLTGDLRSQGQRVPAAILEGHFAAPAKASAATVAVQGPPKRQLRHLRGEQKPGATG